MEPLDLSRRPPRGPREQMLGVMFLPRTIDKMRAALPGGDLAGYLADARSTLSSYVLHKIGVSFEELQALVARAADDAAIETALRERIDPAAAARVNERLQSIRLDGLNDADRERLTRNHPLAAVRPDLVTVLEVLEADDAERAAAR